MDIDDASFAQAKTISEVQQLLKHSIERNGSGKRDSGMWKWNWPISWPVRLFRTVMWYLLIFPLMPLRIVLKVSGRENLQGLRGPILFVANHQSVIDAPIVLRALPLRFRHSLATAMGAGREKIDLVAASLFFNTYPLPVDSIGLKDALEHTGDLVDRGFSILIFPEGLRTEDGNLQPFRNGAGVLATELKIPVLPIVLKGVFEIWPVFANGPQKKGVVQLRFGKPFELSGMSSAEITRVMEKWFQENY